MNREVDYPGILSGVFCYHIYTLPGKVDGFYYLQGDHQGDHHGPSLWLTSLASASNTAYPVLNLNVTYGGLFAKSCLTHVIPWTGAFQARILDGLPFPSPEDLPDPGIELWSPALQADSLPTALHRYFKLNTSPAHTVSLPDLLCLCAVSSENSFTATFVRQKPGLYS